MKSEFINEVVSAMEMHELKAYYQPQYDANNGRLVSAEALVRWEKADGTIISPDKFVPRLEETNAITLLDWFMAEETCRTLHELGEKAVPIAVNFSKWHIKEKDFARKLQSLLYTYNVRPDLFEVEITESAMSEEALSVIKQWTNEVAEIGVKIAIDDFGEGFTSLRFVKDLPVDFLKIDKSFLANNCQDERGRGTLETVFFFANKLNLRTIAEGVETNEQLKFLQNMDCDRVQGFLFCRPVKKEDFLVLAMMDSVQMVDNDNYVKRRGTISSHSLLLKAIKEEYQLVIYGNLYKNSYYVMHADDDLYFDAPTAGIIDDMTTASIERCVSEEEKQNYDSLLSRPALIKAFCRGENRVEAKLVQKINGSVERLSTVIHLMKHPYRDDILMIGMSRRG